MFLFLAFTGALKAQSGPGFALGFDGVDDQVSVTHTNALDPYPLTVTTWFRTTQTGAIDEPAGLVTKFRHSPFAARGGWQLYLREGNLYGLYDYGGDGALEVAGGFVADGGWHHGAFTVNDFGAALYVDGAFREFLPWDSTPVLADSTAALRIGSDGASGFFAGTIDEVTVWKVALSEAQIQANMRRTLSSNEFGLVAYYQFSEGSGTTTVDGAPAGGNNQGSFIGGPTWVAPVATRSAEFGPGSATLKGSVIPILTNAGVWFEWGLATNYGNVTPPQPLDGTNSDFSAIITGLNLSDTYHFRAALSNNFGVAFGADESFNLPPFANINAGLPGTAFGSLAWGDYDNDGRLDLLLAVRATNQGYSFAVKLWRNSSGGFTNVATASGFDTVSSWGDYDNDGRLDVPAMLMDSNQFTFQRVIPIQLAIPPPRVLKNTGAAFSELNRRLDWWVGSAASGDYDNDGRVDLLRTGSGMLSALQQFKDTFGDYAYYPLNEWKSIGEQLWRNTGGGLLHIDAGLPPVTHGSAAWGDYDNDGRLDILICGVSNGVAVSQIWRNSGAGFTNINAGLPGIAYGSAAWGDYDNDGRLDILLAGATGLFPSYDSSNSHYYRGPFSDPGAEFFATLPLLPDAGHPTGLIAGVWRNTGNGFSNINAALPGIWCGSVAWGDYDSDGRSDILLTGATNVLTMEWTDSFFGFTNVQAWPTGFVSQVWRNAGNGFSQINAGLPGVGHSSAAWGDYDKDGRLDIAIAGGTTMFTRYVTNSDGFGGYVIYPTVVVSNLITQVWQNFSPSNSRPTAPTGLMASSANGAVTFSWNVSTDAETPASGLTYNLRVGTAPGAGDLVGPLALSNGGRLVPQFGNAGYRLSRTIVGLPLGRPIYWSVQAVDNGFASSTFAAEQTFTFNSVPTPSNGVPVPGDQNGDGIVDESELNAVLGNYWPFSPWLYMTNVAGLGGTNVTFALTNSLAGAFSVEVTTNLMDWQFLGPATPRYEFTDTNAPAQPQRHYRLRWP